jgi:tetratricopeptide (TPR) repeat protein
VNNALALAGNSASRVNLETGRVLLRAGQWAEALGHLRKAAQELPDAALAWFELGRCQAALGFPEAAATLSQCLKLRPDWQPARRALERFRQRGIFSRLRGFLRRPRKG